MSEISFFKPIQRIVVLKYQERMQLTKASYRGPESRPFDHSKWLGPVFAETAFTALDSPFLALPLVKRRK